LRRGRQQKTRGKGVLSSGANMVKMKNNNASRNNKKKNKRTTQSLSKQPVLRRKRTKMVVALFVGVMSIGQVRAQTTNLSKKINQQT
jgi:hypothetical protein